jgi:hypothetical protein
MRATQRLRLLRVQRRVDAPIHDRGPSSTGAPANLVSAEGIAGVNTDTDNVTRIDRIDLEGRQRFVGNARCAVRGWRCARQHKQPPWCDDANPKREMARIDQMNGHRATCPIWRILL